MYFDILNRLRVTQECVKTERDRETERLSDRHYGGKDGASLCCTAVKNNFTNVKDCQLDTI